MTDTSLDKRRWAKFYASIKHANQVYSLGLPYTHHLEKVEEVLIRFGITDDALLDAAWLHDIIEDTGTKPKEITELFGKRVCELVFAVTNEKADNRKLRAALTYPKIRHTEGAVCLKLADRIANVEHGGKLVSMYKQEYEDFRRSLYTKGEYEEMWTHLDSLLT